MEKRNIASTVNSKSNYFFLRDPGIMFCILSNLVYFMTFRNCKLVLSPFLMDCPFHIPLRYACKLYQPDTSETHQIKD